MKSIKVYYYSFWIGLAFIIVAVLEFLFQKTILPLKPIATSIYPNTAYAEILIGIGCLILSISMSPFEKNDSIINLIQSLFLFFIGVMLLSLGIICLL